MYDKKDTRMERVRDARLLKRSIVRGGMDGLVMRVARWRGIGFRWRRGWLVVGR